VIFESVISKIESWERSVVEYNLADEEDILCLKCGTGKNNIRNKERDLCPKCNIKMNYKVDGEIKLRHKDDLNPLRNGIELLKP
jgi:hypothetical protein